jgi:predicted permease
MDRVLAIEGVESAAYARLTPFSYPSYSSSPLVVEGYQPAPDEQPESDYDEVSPAYLATLGIRLLAGRDLARTDDASAPPVAVVNEEMAARYWPGSSPLGRFFQMKGRRVQVVGVAATSKYGSLQEAATPFFYVPLRQHPATVAILCVRTSLARATLAAALARAVHSLDPGVDATRLSTMREQVDRRSGPPRVALSLVGAFGGLALILAGVGLYGVMSYSVSQRTRELGLRMALGAKPSNLLRLAMSSGLAPAAGGVLLGAAVALGATPLMGDLLYKVSPHDPLVFGSALVVLTIATLAACFVPAWRASRTDPARALRD